jgi:hypothetical protein
MLVNGDEALKAADLLNELYSRYVSTHQQSRQEKADVSAYMIRLYSVLVSIGMKRGWGITSKLLSKSSMVGMSKMKILAQGLVRRVIR